MGCSYSKLEDLPAVALCRDRCRFLDDALRYCHAFCDAHLAYMESLKTMAPALLRFIEQNGGDYYASLNNGVSVISNLDPPESFFAGNSTDQSSSSSNSDSHIQFRSDSEEEDAEKENGMFLKIHKNHFDNDRTRISISNEYTYMNNCAAPKLSPPPPPGNSGWDFMNFFETYEKYEPLFAPNWDCHGVEKFESKHRDKERTSNKPVGGDKKTPQVGGKGGLQKEKPEFEKRNDSSAMRNGSGIGRGGAADMMKEIQMGFESARDSANEVSRLLCYRNGINPGIEVNFTVRILTIAQKQCLNVHFATVISDYLVFDEDASINSPSLYSTLKKLCTWEKKLYAEVKAEERLRLVLEKKCRQLKLLEDRKAADARKIDSTRTLVRNLAAKLKVSIQVVDRISTTTSKLRDGDFWVFITELILGLLGMWRSMLECHKNQHRCFAQAKSLYLKSNNRGLNDDPVGAALQLKAAFENWNLSFSFWIETQKRYVKTLNGWLLRCLLHEPEETLASALPLSPGRIGAPSVFVTFHRWSVAMDKLSENPVIESMNRFIRSLEILLNQFQLDNQEKLTEGKGLDRKESASEEAKKIQAVDKKTFAEAPHQSKSDMCLNLKQIFMALEAFIEDSVRAYEDVCARMGL